MEEFLTKGMRCEQFNSTHLLTEKLSKASLKPNVFIGIKKYELVSLAFLKIYIIYFRASLVAHWLGVRLPMQGTRVRAPVWEDPTCRGAAGPVSHGR